MRYLALFVLILILIVFLFFRSRPSNLSTINLTLGNKIYSVELARNLFEKSKGLGGRTSLCPTCGMLFVYDQESIYPFWMKDTLIPLDMLWLDSQGKIVTIHTALPQPGVSDFQLKSYANTTPAKYVLEINAGQAQQLNLQVGDIIPIKI